MVRHLMLVLLLLLAFPASAETPDRKAAARELYEKAKKAMEERDYRNAALNFEAASQKVPHAVALYTAAQAWELGGENDRAADAYARALETPKLSSSQAARSRERLRLLSRKLGTVVVVSEEPVQVQIDDHTPMLAPVRLYADPGNHVLIIKRKDDKTERRSFAIGAGESLEMDANPSSKAPTVAAKKEEIPLAPPRTHPVIVEKATPAKADPWVAAGWASAGAGIGMLGGAMLLGLKTKDAEDANNDSPSKATARHAEAMALTTNLSLAVGATLTLAGTGILVWRGLAEESKVSVQLSPRGATLRGQF